MLNSLERFLLARARKQRTTRRAVGALEIACLVVVLTAAALTANGMPAGQAARRDHVRAGASTSWAADVRRGLVSKEYEASSNRKGLQAPNRAHGLRTYFEPTGIRVHDRAADAADAELVSLALTGIGRGEALSPVVSGDVVSDGVRVEIRRPGLVEWYENSKEGLEQGFTLAARPGGDGPLVLELSVARARAERVDDEVILETGPGRRLRYSGLVVLDAAGRRLAASMEVRGESRLRLVVDDAGADYPVVVDPTLTSQPPAQIESNLQDAHLGFAVAGAGDVNGDGYDDVIVGAYLYDNGEMDEGAAFVFLGSASGIVGADPSTAHAQLESNDPGAQLGISVAGAGDVNGDTYDDVIVGARFYDDGAGPGGAAFVFQGSAAGIPDGNPMTANAKLVSDQGLADLGSSVAGAGDVNNDTYDDVIVGAPSYDYVVNDVVIQSDVGAAFVFHGSATGIAGGSSTTANSRVESGQDFALLGLDVNGAGDVNGDTYDDVIVGAPLYDDDLDQSNEGAAFVFHGSATGIVSITNGNPLTADAKFESNQDEANFGFSVAGAGDINNDGWDDVIVGADEYDDGEDSEGAAFVFLGSALGIADASPSTAATQLESNQIGADFGISVAGAGDVDNDGFDDVIVGAYLYDWDVGDEGAAFVFRGGGSGIADGNPSTAALSLESDQPDSAFGWSVAGAGDVNDDNLADLVVGAQSHDAGQSDEGAAFVYLVGLISAVPALALPVRTVLACLLLGVSLLTLQRRRSRAKAA